MNLPFPIMHPDGHCWHPSTGMQMSKSEVDSWMEAHRAREAESEIRRLRLWRSFVIYCAVLLVGWSFGWLFGHRSAREANLRDAGWSIGERTKLLVRQLSVQRREDHLDRYYNPDGSPRWPLTHPKHGSDAWREAEYEANPRTATPKPPIPPDEHDIFRKPVYVYYCHHCGGPGVHEFDHGGEHRCPRHKTPMDLIDTEFKL